MKPCIDYRCDNEKKKTLAGNGWSLILSKRLFIRKLKKKNILHGLSILNPNFSEFAFFLVNTSAD